MPVFIDRIKAEQFLPSIEKVPKGVFHHFQEEKTEEWFGLINTGSGFMRRIKETDWVIETDEEDEFESISDAQLKDRYQKEVSSHCEDCGNEFHQYDKRIIHSTSTEYGCYYNGPGICEKCKDKRYEDFIAIKEANG